MIKKLLPLAGVALLAVALAGVTTANAGQAPAGEPCGTCVGVIGDSLTFQAGAGDKNLTKLLTKHGYSEIRIDGLTGRGIAGSGNQAPKPTTVELIQKWRTDKDKNGTEKQWRNEITKVLKAIGPGHTVHWVGLGFRNPDDARVAHFNTFITGIFSEPVEWQRPVTVFHDWNAHVRTLPQDGIWATGDAQGVHMTFPGYKIRNAYVASVIPVLPKPVP
jgi:hypothetical protein